MLKVASWNVNSIKVRLDDVLEWLETSEADVLALQETKSVDENFPETVFTERGYHVAYTGQKTYNGVAIISRKPISNVINALPGFQDEQKRFLAATIEGIQIVNVYVPNGAAVGTDKYAYKLEWLSHLKTWLNQALKDSPKLLVLGDFNIAPDDRDVYDPVAWEGSVLVSAPERAAYQALLDEGLHDSFRLFEQADEGYSWWDYRQARFRRNQGLRIDLILLSDTLKPLCTASQIDVEPRKKERPSDHTPVYVCF